MELNNKEKKIKQVLSDVSYEVDTDFLWKEVSKELDDKKKKRKFFWIFPAVGLGLLALFFFGNYSIVENTIDESQESTLSLETNSYIRNESQQKLNNTSNNTNTSQPSQSSNTATKSIINNSVSKNNQITDSNSVKTNSTQHNPINSYNQKFESKNITGGSLFGSSSLNKINNPVKLDLTLAAANLLKNKTAETEDQFMGYPNITNLIAINNLKMGPIAIEKKKTPAFVLVEPTTATTRFYVTAGLGAIRNINTVITNDDKVPTNLFDREKSLWGMNAALHTGIETKSGFKFFGGFDYTQLVTQYYNGETETVAGQVSSTLESIDTNNNLTTTEGFLATTTTVDNDLLWHRHHNMLNFQVGVSKVLLSKSRFTLEPEVSLLQNIISSHKGYYFSNDSPNFVRFERGEENPYRKNTGLKTQLGLNLGYKYNSWQLTINTGWRNQLSNLTNATNNYQIKNSQLSIQARVNCLLNWEKN